MQLVREGRAGQRSAERSEVAGSKLGGGHWEVLVGWRGWMLELGLGRRRW
jgi:hypothetical protein